MFVVNIGFVVYVIGVLGLVYMVTRRWSRSVNRAIKAHQDLARGVADLANRIERLEKKLGQHEQAKP